MCFLYFTCGKVYVSQSVKLGDDDVYVIRADAVAYAHDGLAAVGAADCMEFARLDFEVLCIKEPGNHVHAARVAAHNNAVRKLFGM